MRVLLATHRLVNRAGSELCALELGRGLARCGHDVGVFTFWAGAIAERFVAAGLRVFTLGDEAALVGFAPEMLHVQHSPCLYHLGSLGLDAAAVFSSLGVVPALESAPIVWAGVGLGLGVSPETLAALRETPFGAEVPLAVFPNWFDDSTLTRAPVGARREVRRVAVVSNHLDPGLARDLDAIATARTGFTWEHVGLPEAPAEVTAELVRSFDLVVTIGRTALLVAACGRPCLLYDIHGCDGLLSSDRIDELSVRNFSGRLRRWRPTPGELEDLLCRRAPATDLESLADVVWDGWSLTVRLRTLAAHYERLLSGPVRLGPWARAAYGRLGEICAEASLEHQSAAAGIAALERRAERAESYAVLLEQAVRRKDNELGTLEEALRQRTERAEHEARSLRDALSAAHAAVQTTKGSAARLERAERWARAVEAEARLKGEELTRLHKALARIRARPDR